MIAVNIVTAIPIFPPHEYPCLDINRAHVQKSVCLLLDYFGGWFGLFFKYEFPHFCPAREGDRLKNFLQREEEVVFILIFRLFFLN